tara:strand:- start:345 stop:575 length:231 start_codon:yes stop_codon:yes gene_type:complete
VSLTLDDIISFIFVRNEKERDDANNPYGNFDWMKYPITVAFKDRDGLTVVSDITSICFNGKSIQLNEEEFDKEVIA